MSRKTLFRRIPGGLLPEQLAKLSPDVLEARRQYLEGTDYELHLLHEIEPPRKMGFVGMMEERLSA